MYRATKRQRERLTPEGQPLGGDRYWALFAQYLNRFKWRHLARHESVALQRLAALSLGEKGAGAEVRPGVSFLVGNDELVAQFHIADNLRDSAVVGKPKSECPLRPRLI